METPVPQMRLLEYSLGFDNISRCRGSRAHLAMRERVFLYSLVYSIGPRWSLEIGTYEGGSAEIISGALDDLQLGGRLISMDPNPGQISIDRESVSHNTVFIEGYFPRDIAKVIPPGAEKFDFAFVDGDHRYEGVFGDLRALGAILNGGAPVLLHDAYHDGVDRAIRDAVKAGWYSDGGRLGRVRNDLIPGALYCGFHLLVKR